MITDNNEISTIIKRLQNNAIKKSSEKDFTNQCQPSPLQQL